ncbi:metal dependent phosphohydrolase with GAF sensor [Planococcus antarcticus DSM 14505]|uniref:Metal dependent phosphohydrolase with GAF sensor n=1 Tax=Planococcus antarcticus DSM 14505 TaxID=1185653 RepID=A0AA87IPG6_9BACL|nr:HD domain-containing phosphohydrolase [Planococcus antarcticus]EIM08455.1 metal dependent phosphohydrolase with GAF sensor [Planococcus antarcticus DSM 14505]
MTQLKDLELRVQELVTLLEASNQLNSNIEMGEVLENILLQMVQVVGAEAGTLWVLNKERQKIKAVAAYGPSAFNILNLELEMDEGIVGKVIGTGEAQLIENVASHPNWAHRVDHSSGFVTKSMITVPLAVKGQVLGALQLLNKKDIAFFSEQDISLAVALANQSALALHNSQMYDELQRMLLSMIRTLAKVLDARDPYTAGHSERVAKYSLWIAQKLGFDAQSCEELYKAALLHDIGKIGIPDDILRKPGRLTNNEYTAIKKHTIIGADILSNIEPKDAMVHAIQIALSHHERLDGSGYPHGLVGEEIPLFARIVGVADAFDAMTTARSYSAGSSFESGAEELLRCKDTLFDGKVVDAFATILQDCDYEVEQYEAQLGRGYRL